MTQQAGSTGPKYRRIVEDLRAAIADGDYPPGSRLPTKAELMTQYQVAVNTVERAIKELREDGLVETAQGAGMYVRDPEPRSSEVAALSAERLTAAERDIKNLQQRLSEIEQDRDDLRALVMDLYGRSGRSNPSVSTEEILRRGKTG